MSGTTGPTSGSGADSTVTLLVTMTFAPEHEEAFLALATSVVAQVTANEPGTLLFALTRHPERDHTYTWIERYRDQPALDLHRDAAYIVAALAQLPGWWSAPPEVVQLSEVMSA